MTDEIVLCDAAVEACVCKLPVGHEGLHECREVELCDGSWGYDAEGKFIVGRYPKAAGLANLMGLRP